MAMHTKEIGENSVSLKINNNDSKLELSYGWDTIEDVFKYSQEDENGEFYMGISNRFRELGFGFNLEEAELIKETLEAMIDKLKERGGQ
jgi:hypothetical protein